MSLWVLSLLEAILNWLEPLDEVYMDIWISESNWIDINHFKVKPISYLGDRVSVSNFTNWKLEGSGWAFSESAVLFRKALDIFGVKKPPIL